MGEGAQMFEIAQDQRAAGLQDEYARRVCDRGFENPRHLALIGFGGLVGVDQRGAIDALVLTKFAREEFGCVVLEGCELAPALPVFRLESGVDAHGRDIAVSAGESTIARGREGVCEAGLGDEAGGFGEDRRRQSVARACGHTSIVNFVRCGTIITGTSRTNL